MNQFKQLCLAVLSSMLLSTTVEAGRSSRRSRAVQPYETKEQAGEDEEVSIRVNRYFSVLQTFNEPLEEALKEMYKNRLLSDIARTCNNGIELRSSLWSSIHFNQALKDGNLSLSAPLKIRETMIFIRDSVNTSSYSVVRKILRAANKRRLHTLTELALAEPLRKSLDKVTSFQQWITQFGLQECAVYKDLKQIEMLLKVFLALNKKLIAFIKSDPYQGNPPASNWTDDCFEPDSGLDEPKGWVCSSCGACNLKDELLPIVSNSLCGMCAEPRKKKQSSLRCSIV